MQPMSSCRNAILQAIETLASDYLHGKVKSIRLSMVSFLAQGHLLLEDTPGLGKTTLALAFSRILGLSFGRVQCTSDLLPSDITGLSIFDRSENQFRFVPGPIFANVLLVDEINRAMPKTQSALLEAMEERRVTVEGKTYDLPQPFFVIATQNPVEQVGTFPLPESQLDRFLVKTGIGYPPEEVEKKIFLGGSIRNEIHDIPPVVERDALLSARQDVRSIHLSHKLVDYIYAIVAETRRHRLIDSGISTRGGISLADAARAVAYLEGRDFVVPEDVKEVALAVGAHRVMLKNEQSGVRKEEVLASILSDIQVPIV